MYCKKCKKEIPDVSKFYNICGAKQIREHSVKKYGNGHGTVYKDKNGKWIAEYTIGWGYDEEEDITFRRKHKKRGFATRNEAIAYLPNLKQVLPQQNLNVKFKRPRVRISTLGPEVPKNHDLKWFFGTFLLHLSPSVFYYFLLLLPLLLPE